MADSGRRHQGSAPLMRATNMGLANGRKPYDLIKASMNGDLHNELRDVKHSEIKGLLLALKTMKKNRSETFNRHIQSETGLGFRESDEINESKTLKHIDEVIEALKSKHANGNQQGGKSKRRRSKNKNRTSKNKKSVRSKGPGHSRHSRRYSHLKKTGTHKRKSNSSKHSMRR